MNDHIVVLSGLPESGIPLLRERLAAGGMRFTTPRGNGWHWMLESPDRCALVPWQRLHLIPADRRYRVVFLRRNLGEIVISRLSRLAECEVDRLPSADLLLCRYQRAFQGLCGWLDRAPNVEVMHLNHADLAHDSQVSLRQACEFLNLSGETWNRGPKIGLTST